MNTATPSAHPNEHPTTRTRRGQRRAPMNPSMENKPQGAKQCLCINPTSTRAHSNDPKGQTRRRTLMNPANLTTPMNTATEDESDAPQGAQECTHRSLTTPGRTRMNAATPETLRANPNAPKDHCEPYDPQGVPHSTKRPLIMRTTPRAHP